MSPIKLHWVVELHNQLSYERSLKQLGYVHGGDRERRVLAVQSKGMMCGDMLAVLGLQKGVWFFPVILGFADCHMGLGGNLGKGSCPLLSVRPSTTFKIRKELDPMVRFVQTAGVLAFLCSWGQRPLHWSQLHFNNPCSGGGKGHWEPLFPCFICGRLWCFWYLWEICLIVV